MNVTGVHLIGFGNYGRLEQNLHQLPYKYC